MIHFLVLGVGDKVQALAAGLAHPPLQVDIGGRRHNGAGHKGQERSRHGGGAVVVGRDQVLNLGGVPGTAVMVMPEGAGGNGAGRQGCRSRSAAR